MKNILLISTAVLILKFANGQPNHSPLTYGIYALVDVTIIDANNKKSLANQTVLIKDKTILNIFPVHSIKLNDSIKVFNCKGKYVIPGLIDTHVHIDQEDNGKANRDSAEFYLKRMLLSGITTLRDMYGDARFLSCLSRDAMLDDIASPNIYYSALMAGPGIINEERSKVSVKGGIPGKMPYQQELTDSTNLVLAMAEAKGCGATGIKVYGDVEPDLLFKTVREAKRQGLRVWSHAAIIPANVFDAVNSGVQVISHANGLIRETLGDIPFPEEWKKRQDPEHSDEYWNEELKKYPLNNLFVKMKENNVIFDATLILFKNIAKGPKQKWIYEITKRIVSDAYKANVKISTGTDGTLRNFAVQDEIETLVTDCNFSPIDAIISATKIGAEAIDIESTCGTIELNKDADLIILDKNPLENINNIHAVNMVIKNGLIYTVN